jgi:ADP-ribose pyrophosphatase YjhB (NUDIX family)
MTDEVAGLSERYGAPLRVSATLPASDFDPLASPRAAEVGMVVRRKSGKLLLNTKEFYPEGVFRIPTGGVKEGEPVERALLREVAEETNLRVEVERFLAVITHHASGRERPFTTYAFLLREVAGNLKVNDPGERISGWLEVDVEDLKGVAERLAGLEGRWAGWGRFRSVLHGVVGELLEKGAAVAE